jgi:hypothetical protein
MRNRKENATEKKTKEPPMSKKYVEAEVDSAVASVKETVTMSVEEAVRKAVAEAKGTVKDAVVEVLEEEAILVEPSKADMQKSDSREAKPHAFVVMPFGKKEGFDGTVIDFDWAHYLSPQETISWKAF